MRGFTYVPWTGPELTVFKELYPISTMNELQTKFDRTHDSIMGMARILGLRKTVGYLKDRKPVPPKIDPRDVVRRPWTDEEVTILTEDLPHVHVRHIAARLGRTSLAVRLKAYSLAASKSQPVDSVRS